ncbi:glycosyltransferase family 1 protein [Bradyrhizobium prioriisuperbiae]|uniref:glycosyltransferase family 4 protein n=1 Tax=Bradyrhizobium prioriisuperbiae TaxID=2854389 RepID=UPI0028EF2C97|nr:glycosyltransferase family 1 protein [Bradyrhizobium prioritasuperba]
MKIFINGRFLSQSLTGVQRYAAEMVRAMDRLLISSEAPRALVDAEWQLLLPPDANVTIDLKRIESVKIGRRSGHAWDQIDLAQHARNGHLISLANSGPVFHPRHLVVIHDAQVFQRPEFFSWTYLTAHRSLGYLLARTATIATVSDFSRHELASVLRLTPTSIPVFSNSAEHFAATVPDLSVIERLKLRPYNFFLSVGSMTRNKNIALAVQAAKQLNRPDMPLVVVGGGNNKVFQGESTSADDSVIMAGRLTDEEIAALYSRAAAFVFPSLYEGFGVPPLEAMTFGCPVIATTADAVRETCGDAASYFDPHNADALRQRMMERIVAGRISDDERRRQQARLTTFSWRRSASAMLQFLDKKTDRAGTTIEVEDHNSA